MNNRFDYIPRDNVEAMAMKMLEPGAVVMTNIPEFAQKLQAMGVKVDLQKDE